MQTTKKFQLQITDIIPFLVWTLVFIITCTFMRSADHFLEMTPAAMGKYYDFKWILISHITAGGGSIILGLLQFWKKLRAYSWKLHRLIGFLYLAAVLVSSIGAVILALTTAFKINVAYAFSLQVWVSVWISSTTIAYYFAVNRKIKLHQEWMVRSYIVTLAFVLSGLILKIPFIKNIGTFEDLSPSLFWFGWAIPLYIYELIKSK